MEKKLRKITIKGLRSLAETFEIEGRSKMKRAELMEVLKKQNFDGIDLSKYPVKVKRKKPSNKRKRKPAAGLAPRRSIKRSRFGRR